MAVFHPLSRASVARIVFGDHICSFNIDIAVDFLYDISIINSVH